mmetsp:Transcript_53020/g.128639  ORF Transcript_53020/g.128639 Transcript_53020/m.128639 type:complete len:311 (+) Transcript_53020:1569-2501(+)
MKFPTIFCNHGGGPLPLLGRQLDLVQGMKDAVQKYLPPIDTSPPSAIVVLSAHWESDPISITSSPNPSLYYDYHGFPPESYNYKYPVPGNPALAEKIQHLLSDNGIKSQLDDERGLDHGVFVPLMIMYPHADIPVVQVSLHPSLDAQTHINIGKALSSLRESDGDENILILGSGYTFHNMNAFFNPSKATIQASNDFNTWLKSTILVSPPSSSSSLGDDDEDDVPSSSCLSSSVMYQDRLHKLSKWDKEAPGARIAHPREEHLLPLLMVVAAAGEDSKPTLIYDTTTTTSNSSSSTTDLSQHAVTGYIFE